jgi:hypothetical protein
MTSGFQRNTQDVKIAARIDFKGFAELSWMVLEVLMVRRPDSPNQHNHLNYINIKSFKSSLYTHLYTQLILVCYHYKSMS